MRNPAIPGCGMPLFQGIIGKLGLKLLTTRQYSSRKSLLTYLPERATDV